MSAETFCKLVEILTNEQLRILCDEGMLTDEFIFILKTEMYKRCLI